ncbi:putative galactarate transporter [Moorella thermoacetica]|uniref:Galactarate transporter n=1 Tax=Neomoorella thermoacetica TaxID=1525 RepID=A0AAC9MTL6_NEOTH|nr:MFS transporter [Moorella thermoacetica]AOQ22739.1 putative galactarate transporter [Moorella thermoacetica]TYL06832.1 putative galactarate transporter [Moorella thermoacetica]
MTPSQLGTEKKTHYRWVVLLLIFIAYTINMADRSNIGVVLPFLGQEFSINNFEKGAIASFFFLGYAISQIPAGFWLGKRGSRGIVSLAIVGFSTFTYLLGTVSSAAALKWLRLGLGLAEGPAPVGMTSTINQWFPAKEKATATGVYIASTQFAPIIVPIIAVWVAVNYGWRAVFYWFAIPGFVMAAMWYIFVRTKPEESSYVSPAELHYIRQSDTPGQAIMTEKRSLGWLDKLIRYKKVNTLDTNGKIFTSWNIWGDTLAYFFMVSVLYGMLTWIPSYLVTAKHYSFIKMGFVAATPSIGGLIGAIFGGWLSDKVFLKRRKPTMLITALSTALMMLILINLPENVTIVAIALFMTGFLLNVGWPAFTAYPMGLTTRETYPVAIAVINSGGNLGGFFSPMIVGALLDAFKNYNLIFLFFGLLLIIAFFLILTLEEPVQN